MYSNSLLQHFNGTHHAGSLSNASAEAHLGSKHEGRLLHLSIRVQNHQIAQARYKVYGCPATIATAEYVATWLEQKPLTKAQQMTSNEIIKDLQLPPHKHYCALLAEDAIKQVVMNYEVCNDKLSTNL